MTEKDRQQSQLFYALKISCAVGFITESPAYGFLTFGVLGFVWCSVMIAIKDKK